MNKPSLIICLMENNYSRWFAYKLHSCCVLDDCLGRPTWNSSLHVGCLITKQEGFRVQTESPQLIQFWLLCFSPLVQLNIVDTEDQLPGKKIKSVDFLSHKTLILLRIPPAEPPAIAFFSSHVWILSRVKKWSLDPPGWWLSVFETHIITALSCQRLVHHRRLPSAQLITPSHLSAHRLAELCGERRPTYCMWDTGVYDWKATAEEPLSKAFNTQLPRWSRSVTNTTRLRL